MARHISNTYINQTVSLDGNYFEGCIFKNCILEFGGTAPLGGFVDNTFADCQWSLVGPAVNTLQFLSGLYNGLGPQGQQLVEQIIDQIRRGNPAPQIAQAQPA